MQDYKFVVRTFCKINGFEGSRTHALVSAVFGEDDIQEAEQAEMASGRGPVENDVTPLIIETHETRQEVAESLFRQAVDIIDMGDPNDPNEPATISTETANDIMRRLEALERTKNQSQHPNRQFSGKTAFTFSLGASGNYPLRKRRRA